MTTDSYNNQLHLSFRNDNWDIKLAKQEGLGFDENGLYKHSYFERFSQ